MGKGAGLESHGWGAIGAKTSVQYGATWVEFFPDDVVQMTAEATSPQAGDRLRRSSAGNVSFDANEDKVLSLLDEEETEEQADSSESPPPPVSPPPQKVRLSRAAHAKLTE